MAIFTPMGQEEYLIGTIDFDDYIEEDKLDCISFNRIGSCEIWVHTRDEGKNIPHFHIKQLNGNHDICIQIYKNQYFSHGHNDGMFTNNKQCRQLQEWMNKRSRTTIQLTNWQAIQVAWELANGSEYNGIKSQPDYSVILPY